jgi:aspartate aminotransferase
MMTSSLIKDGSKFSKLAEGLAGSDIIRLAWEINDRKKKGEEVFNMTIGDFNPDYFPIPEGMVEEIHKAYLQHKTNYPQAEGLPELKKAVSGFLKRRGGFDVDPCDIQIASGARPLVYSIFQILVNEGETVVYGVPSWNNEHFVYLSRAKGVPINSGPEHNFLPTAASIQPYIHDAALIALCSPLNPTGTVYRAEDLKEICEIIVAENAQRKIQGRKPVYLMFDQIYWRLTYGSIHHVHPVGLVPEMKDYTIYVDGISKAFCATGVRLGWAFGPTEVMDKMKHFLGHVGAWAPKPEQSGVAAFLDRVEDEAKYNDWVKDELSTRLFSLYHGIQSLSAMGLPVTVMAPEAALYLSVRFPLFNKRFNNTTFQDTASIMQFLLNEAGLAVVAFRSFGVVGLEDWFRVSVGSCSKEEITTLLDRLKSALLQVK